MVAAEADNRGLPPLSTVGSFCPLPELPYAGDSVVPDVCLLALEALQRPLAAIHGDAQNDTTLATTPGERAGVGTAEPLPRFDEPARLCRDEPSNSPVQ